MSAERFFDAMEELAKEHAKAERVGLALERLGRWRDTGKTTPSGRCIFRCLKCNRETDKPTDCSAGCSDE